MSTSTSAPLVIIDGTHIILLPDIDASSNNLRDDYTVPAVRLKDVSKIIDKRYITLNGNVEIDVENSAGKVEGIIERMQVDVSEIIQDVGITRPMEPLRNKPSSLSTIRICMEPLSQFVSKCLSDDRLEVHLPMWGGSNCDAHNTSDDICIYGEKYNDVLHDYGASSRVTSNKQYIDIHNAGSCLVADFIGLGGYQQLLVLPQIDDEITKKLQPRQTFGTEELFQQWSKLITSILTRSLLVDGYGVLLPKQTKQFCLEKRDDYWTITLPKLALDDSFDGLTKDDVIHASNLETPKLSTDANKPMDIDNRTDTEIGKSSIDPTWLKTLQMTIEQRISRKLNEDDQVETTNQMCQKLVTHGRNTLQRAIRGRFGKDTTNCTTTLQDPKIARLRYGIQPRSAMATSGVSLVMDLEVDVYLSKVQQCENNNLLTNAEESEGTSSSVNEFHISCILPHQNDNDSGVSCEQIRTASGLVPVFEPGECVTVSASLYFTNLDIVSSHDLSTCSTLKVYIQGHWIDPTLSESQANQSLSCRQGTILCALELTEDMFYQSNTSKTLSSCGGRCMQYEIDFVGNANDGEEHISQSIFEHREPCTFIVDTSKSALLQDPKMWKDLVLSMNDRIGMNSHIDLCWKRGDVCLKLIIFAFNQTEQTAIRKLLMRHLPVSAKLIRMEDL